MRTRAPNIMNKQTIILTGGAGFLGSHVLKRLLDEGHSVRVWDDLSNGKEMHLAPFQGRDGFHFERIDISDRDAVLRTAVGATVFIHLAVLDLRQSIKDPQRVNEVVVTGTLNCLDAAREQNVELFLNCSSSEAYGSAVHVPMAEDHPLHPETPYAAAKAAQDLYVRSYGQTYDLPWLTLRPFNMYGPNSHWQGFRGELIPKMIVRAMSGEPLVVFGDGGQTRDFIYVEDAAEAFLRALDAPACRSRVINVCTSVETSIRDIAEQICRAFDIEPAHGIAYQPGRPGDVRRHLGDSRLMAEYLGFRPGVGFKDGLQRTIAWYKNLPMAPAELLAHEVVRNWE